MEKEIRFLRTPEGREPFFEWFYSLHDPIIRQRISARIQRIRQGNYGDHKRFEGIIEIRFAFGKGYRIYCVEDGLKIIILLAGGDKSSQNQDIKEALEYWRIYEKNKI